MYKCTQKRFSAVNDPHYFHVVSDHRIVSANRCNSCLPNGRTMSQHQHAKPFSTRLAAVKSRTDQALNECWHTNCDDRGRAALLIEI